MDAIRGENGKGLQEGGGDSMEEQQRTAGPSDQASPTAPRKVTQEGAPRRECLGGNA